MNHDENKPEMQTWIEPELEARVVAWISGEASAFEAAELERLVSEKPELAFFKQRMEAVRGLVTEAVRPDPAPLRLAPERRAKFLETLRAVDGVSIAEEVVKKPDAPVAFPLYGARKPRRARWWRRTGTIAAGLMLGLFFSTLIRYSSTNYEKPRASLAEFDQVMVKLPQSTAIEEPRDPETGAASENAKEAFTTEKRRQPREKVLTHAQTDAPSQVGRPQRGDLTAVNAPAPSGGVADKDNLVPPFKVTYSGSIKTATQGSSEVQFGGSGRTYNAARLPDADRDTLANRRVFGTGAPERFEYTKDERSRGANGVTSQYNQEIKPPNTLLDPRQMSFAAGKLKKEAAADSRSKEALLASNEETVTLSPFEVVAAPRGEIAAGLHQPLLQGNRQVKSDLAFSDDKKQIAERVATIEAPVLDVIAPAPQVAAVTDAASPATVAPKPAEELTPPIQEVNAKLQPVSTFSLHVSDVSFRLAQAALDAGELPDPARIRSEEFYNAFNYGDPAPAMAEKIACRIEQSAFPLLQQRNLVRIAMKVPAVGHGVSQPLRLTLLLDTSGSMEREDRAATVRRAMEVLVSLLGPNDRLTVIGFARQPRLLVDQLSGDQAQEALTAIAHTPSEGGTDLEAALKLASELALRSRESTAQNRIVLLTDGAANLGNADPAQLASAIEALRQQGVAFDACGVGLDGIDDAMLERLTRKGDGRYYVLNTPEAADTGFAHQLAGAFRPAAENVKVQVRFNPGRVGAYRLIGFEQHRLKEEDFRNDQVDAAELAAEEAAVAVYQVETLPQGEGEIGEVYVRFRDASNGNMVERSWTLSYDPQVAAFDRATPSLQLAGVAVLLAEKLRGGALADTIRLEELAPVVNALRGRYSHEPRVQELVTMYEQLRRLKHE